jgi:D-alanyl-D-alanine carboxypeptidase (penicillin-binding protein 5/6)
VDDTRRVLYEKNAGAVRANASTTKMATALVVASEVPPDDRVLVSATAATIGGGGLDLHAGEVFSVEALLHALLLTSSNEAAVALAEHVSGSERAFVDMMNEYSRSIGALDTHFVTAHGLDMPGHGSSARDLATIAAELLDVERLARIVARTEVAIDAPSGRTLLENRNLLLESYPGATGVKTGFTADAGNVLVASAERAGRRVIAVAMDSVDATADAIALLDLGWLLLERTVLLARGAQVGALVFEQGSTEVRAASRVRGSLRPADVAIEFIPDPNVRMPVYRGEIVGRVIVISNGRQVTSVDAVAADAIQPSEASWASDVFAGLLRAVGSLVGEP